MNYLSAEPIIYDFESQLGELAYNLTLAGAPRIVTSRVIELLEGASGSYLLPNPRVTCNNGWYGCTLTTNNRSLEILFDADSNDWKWYYTSTERDVITTTSYEGDCSKHVDDLIFYWLPDSILQSIKLPEKFNTHVTRMIHRQSQLSMLWATIRYDGLMAGFCYYNDRIHYYRCVEETEHEGKRLYALYSLPWYERVRAILKRWGWTCTLRHTPLWSIYSWWFATHPNLNNTQKQSSLANPDLLVGHFV